MKNHTQLYYTLAPLISAALSTSVMLQGTNCRVPTAASPAVCYIPQQARSVATLK